MVVWVSMFVCVVSVVCSQQPRSGLASAAATARGITSSLQYMRRDVDCGVGDDGAMGCLRSAHLSHTCVHTQVCGLFLIERDLAIFVMVTLVATDDRFAPAFVYSSGVTLLLLPRQTLRRSCPEDLNLPHSDTLTSAAAA